MFTLEEQVIVSVGLKLIEEKIVNGEIANDFFRPSIIEQIAVIREKLLNPS